jgi:hypothetical protein
LQSLSSAEGGSFELEAMGLVEEAVAQGIGEIAKTFSPNMYTGSSRAEFGHNLPHEAPQAFAKAIVDVDGY